VRRRIGHCVAVRVSNSVDLYSQEKNKRRNSQLSSAKHSGDRRQGMYDINPGQIVDSKRIINRIDKPQRRRPLRQHAPQRQPPDHSEAIEDEDGPAVVVLWAAVVCVVPVGDDDACRDGGEDAEAESAVAPKNDGGDDVKDQDEDGDDNLGEADGEDVGGEGDDLFVRHCEW
jgi:hypothetical protein